MLKTHSKATSKGILEMLDPEIPECSGLIRQRLIKANLRARIAVKKPLMTESNLKKRLDWCRKINVLTIFPTKAPSNCIQRGELLSEDLEMHHYAQNIWR